MVATTGTRSSAHEVAVDPSHQDHAGDVEGLGVGHPQAVDEGGHLAEAGHELTDLRTTAVDHDDLQAGRVEQDDVLGEAGQCGLVAHGVAAVLHHHHVSVEAAEVRQRLDEDHGLLGGAQVGHRGTILRMVRS
jgi:hypothetical protein